MTKIVPLERIAASIRIIRAQKVLLDADLASLYGVETKVFNQAVRRNIERFPEDFMFQLTPEEAESLRSQIVTLKVGRGRHAKYAPLAFTEQGVEELARKVSQHDRQIAALVEHVQKLLVPAPIKKKMIGFQ